MLSRRRDRGVAGGEGCLDLREGLLWLDHPTKNFRTAMLCRAPLPSTPPRRSPPKCGHQPLDENPGPSSSIGPTPLRNC
jgi:hypothetical protein